MTTVLTPTQMFLLLGISDGEGISQDLPGDDKCAHDVEQLRSSRLINWKDSELHTTAAGRTHLEPTYASPRKESFGGLRVVHGHDQSITVEFRPAQE